MYRNIPTRRMGDPLTDAFSAMTVPDASLGGLSPMMVAGLGLLAIAVLTSWTGKGVRRVRRSLRKRAQKREQISALKSQLKQLGA